MAGIAEAALAFIDSYALLAVFILLVLDGAMLLPVFPGEIVMILAVARYADDPASLALVIVVATAASLVGSMILYAIMRGGGRRVVERFPRLFMMPARRRERMEATFQRPVGQTLVLFLRLFPLTRVLVNIPAGLAKMPLVRFVVMSAIGLALYHVAFLWFTYEAGRPDSAIGGHAAQLNAAYASPAWEFVQANAIGTGAVLLLIGIIASIRASRRMTRDPEGAGSIIGALAWILLFWGGVALAVVTYTDPDAVVRLVAIGGVDIEAAAGGLGIQPATLLFAVAGVAFVFALLLRSVRRQAKRWRSRTQADQQALDEAATRFPAWHGREEVPESGFEVVPHARDEEPRQRDESGS
jgi:membrane protein DedA with SNARE-associated domain